MFFNCLHTLKISLEWGNFCPLYLSKGVSFSIFLYFVSKINLNYHMYFMARVVGLGRIIIAENDTSIPVLSYI